MSSTAFVAPPALELAPSRAFAVLLIGGHVIACAIAFVLPAPWLIQSMLAIGLIANAVRSVRWHALLTGGAAIVRVQWLGDGDWVLTQRDGKTVDAQLQPGSYVHPLLLVLNFKLSGGGRRAVVVFGGRADADAVRRWRAALAAQRSAAG